MELTKTVDKTTVTVGSEITYTLTATNTGNEPAQNIKITDPLNYQVSFVDGSATEGGTLVGDTLEWNVSSIDAGQSFTTSFKVKVQPPSTKITFYISANGNDNWSGKLAEPNATGTDGPLKSLEAVKARIRNAKSFGPVTLPIDVILRGGTYELSQSFGLTEFDSGAEGLPVTFKSFDQEKAIISGGKEVKGTWQQYSADGKIWKVNIPEVTSGNWQFNSLFVNGERAIRSREPDLTDATPYYTYSTAKDDPGRFTTFTFSSTDINPNWRNLTDVEIVSYRRWVDSRFKIQSVLGNRLTINGTLDYQGKAAWEQGFASDYDSTKGRYYVENFLEGIDQEGEWYLDKTTGDLYYHRRAGEIMNTAKVVAPQSNMRTLINAEKLQYVNFENLTFSYIDWVLPNFATLQGYVGNWAGYHESMLPAMVSLHDANHINFTNNEFIHAGGYALDLRASNTNIDHNNFSDLASGGIRLGNNGSTTAFEQFNTITNNKIKNFGQVFKYSDGIFLVVTGDNRVANNEIANGAYAGIIVGTSTPQAINKNNLVEFNRVYNVMQELNDGGAIYMIGPQPGSKIDNNLIYDAKKTGFQLIDKGIVGIYLDDQSSDITVKNNIVYRTGVGLNLHLAKRSLVTNNIFAESSEAAASYPGNLPVGNADGNTVTKNIFYQPTALFPTFKYTTDNNIAIKASDLNIYYPEDPVARSETLNNFWVLANLAFWRSSFALDAGSQTADPQFESYTTKNFNLKSTSPALGLGFTPIDLSKIGTNW